MIRLTFITQFIRSPLKRNKRTVMFRIVEDESPPIPERFSGPLLAFLKECFHKDPAMRPSAEQLFEHEWLKNHWGLNKVSLARRHDGVS